MLHLGRVTVVALGALLLGMLAAGPGIDREARALRKGTEALRADRPQDAVPWLETAAAAVDPGLRVPALHDLALAHLALAARSQPGAIEHHAEASVEAARAALRIDPRATDTRWNLMLAQDLLIRGGERRAQGPTTRATNEPELGTPGAAPNAATDPAPDPVPEIERAGRTLDALRDGEVENALREMVAKVSRGRPGGTVW